jgi:hypothetical protein
VLLNRGQAKLHLLVGIPTAVLTAGCIYYYVQHSILAGGLLGGGSSAGLLCGVVAGLVIVFEMALAPRKALRRLRLIPTKYWLAAHLWLGLASLPLAIVHSGFHLGGWLPTTFMVLFVLTIISGVYGMLVQNILPRWMLRNLPAETIYNQIDYVSEQAFEDARHLLVAACGRQVRTNPLEQQPELEAASTGTIVVGAVRQAGRTRGRTLETRRVVSAVEDHDALWNALAEIEPFLKHGQREQTPVTDAQKASQWFARLRRATGPESGSIIEVLEGLCDQRRQFDTQQCVHRWLHAWLPIHVGLSIAVTVLLVAHVWTALMYW